MEQFNLAIVDDVNPDVEPFDNRPTPSIGLGFSDMIRRNSVKESNGVLPLPIPLHTMEHCRHSGVVHDVTHDAHRENNDVAPAGETVSNTSNECPEMLTIRQLTGTLNVAKKLTVTNVGKQSTYNTHHHHHHHHHVTHNNTPQPACCDLENDAEVTASLGEDPDPPSLCRTEDLDQAAQLLTENGLVILSGLPRSGKTVMGRALLTRFGRQDYSTRELGRLCCQPLSVFVGEGEGRGIVLMDGVLGELNVDTEQLKRCQELVFRHARRRPGCSRCLIVITAYPHVLDEVRALESGSDRPLLRPSEVVHLTARDPLNPTTPLVPAVTTYTPWLLRSVDDPVTGTGMAALLALSMLGLGDFLHDPPAVRSELQRLGFSNESCCRLDRLASKLKGFVLARAGRGFCDRVMYDTAGLVLGLRYLPVVLKVCDARFLVEHVQTSPDDTPAESSIILVGPAAVDRQLLMQRMHELIGTGQARELAQHPSLGSPSFLEELRDFCAKNKSRKYAQQLVGAVDAERGLPLLYWSVWSPSSHLAHWCLRLTMEHAANVKRNNTLTGNLLSTAFATLFFTPAVPAAAAADTAKSRAKAFAEELLSLKLKPAPEEDTLNLTLPRTDAGASRDERQEKRLASQTRLMMRGGGRCCSYLDNDSLPIPAALLTVTVTEDAVRVRLPARRWYLVLRLLADREPDETDRNGNTVLHLAADTGDLEAVRLALLSGASLAAQNSKGLTPYQLSERRLPGKKKCRVFGGKGRNEESAAALHRACKEGDLETVKTLLCLTATLQDRGDHDDTPLHSACREGQTRVASLLIQLGADVRARNRFRVTPLHAAAHSGHLAAATLLVEKGADVNARADSRTPLHLASWKGHVDLVTFLVVQPRVDVNVKGFNGYTALHEACVHHRPAVARLLLRRGDVKVDVRDSWGHSPLHCACRLSHVDLVLLLLEHGADVHAKNERGWSPADEAVLNGKDNGVAAALLKHPAVKNIGA